MSITEKVNLTTGTGWGSGPCVGNTGSVPRLGIPNICLQDGPNGVRFTDFGTHFPSGLAAAATFNKGLMYLRGKAIGKEHKKKGVHVALGPVIGPMGLKAAGGRNWESFGADPYLQGVGGAATVEGMQDEGVLATARHFIGNEQEHFRQVGEWEENGWDKLESAISSNIGDRAMHEVYLWPFADVVRAGVASVMCSYNQVNNTYACENSYLLNFLLKEELAFQGFVVSDWGAQHSGVNSALAGLDMTMPGEVFDDWLTGKSYWGALLTRAVYNGTISQDRLNDMVTRILAPFFAIESVSLPTEEDVPNFSSWTHHTYGQEFPYQHFGPIVQKNWHVDARSEFSDNTALTVAKEAIVLLKNSGHHLPIDKSDGVRRILVAGKGAGPDPNGFNCKDQRCVDGVLTSGWGSAAVNNPFVITPYEAIAEKARDRGIVIDYSSNVWDLENIEELADYADISIVVVNTFSGEGYVYVEDNFGDRQNLSLWHNGDQMIESIAEKCKKTVVVVTSTGPVNMEKWIENENVVAVIFAPPLGQFVGQAIADVLFGDTNPSGKLPFTLARKKQHYVPIIDDLGGDRNPQDNFDRDIYLDYRFFDKHNIKPRFEFGFGLSYTSFKVCNLKITEINPPSEYLPYPQEYLPIFKTIEDDICDPEDALFPHDEMDPAPGYIYPYLYNENIRSSEEDDGYDYPRGYDPDQPTTPTLAGGGLGGNPALWEVLYEVSAEVVNDGKLKGGNGGESLYPTLSDINDRDTVSNSIADKYSSTTYPGKDKSPVLREPTSKLPLRSWDTYNKDRADLWAGKNATSERFSDKLDTKKFSTDLNRDTYTSRIPDDDFKSKYSRNYLENRSASYGVDKTDQSNYTNPTRYYSAAKRDSTLGSPIKSLNSSLESNKRKNRSLYKVLGSTPLKPRVDHKITKLPRKKHSMDASPGILSRLYSYFTNPGEDDDVKMLKNSARNILHIDPVTEKKVAFDDRTDSIRSRRQFEIDSEKDAVDEAIRRSKERERNLENERLKNLEYERLKNLEKLNNRLEVELRQEVLNKENVVREYDNLKSKYEQETSQLQEMIESLKTEIITKEKKERKQMEELKNFEHEKYRMELALGEVKKELEIQLQKNKTIPIEVELRVKLKSVRLGNDVQLNPLYIEFAQICKRINDLEQEYRAKYSTEPEVQETLITKQIQRVDKKFDVASSELKNYTESLENQAILEPYENFFGECVRYLDKNRTKIWKFIDSLVETETPDSRNYKEMFANLHCLKSLNNLSRRLVELKELLNDCKILEEFKTSGVDVPKIYKDFSSVTL
ncbi:Beta-glucosidase 2 [Spathaspora sp. JA1]|nr:Beta-glucosidase 2 [Spathaspora sp. JA1]